MKKIFSLFFGFFMYESMAQQSVGIGTTTPDNRAVLDLTSTTKGCWFCGLNQISKTYS